MAQEKKLYVVDVDLRDGKDCTRKHLVRAVNKTQALGFVARNHITVTVPEPEELLNLGKLGLDIEDATVEQVDLPTG